jgi:hypothetical protein
MTTSVADTRLPDNTERVALDQDLTTQLRFQRRWRVISMSAYVVTTIGTIICSAGATLMAARGASKLAAVLSATATVLIGTEKFMLFRKKWKFHLLMFARLNVLKAKVALARISTAEASDEFASIMSLYANELPVASRDEK